MNMSPTDSPSPHGRSGCARLFRVLLACLILAGLLAGAYVFLAHRRGADYLHELEESTRQEEGREQASLLKRLTALEKSDRSSLIDAALSTSLLNRLVSELDGIAFDLPIKGTDHAQLKLGRLQADFHDGFPAIKVAGTAKYQTYPPVTIETRAVLHPRLHPDEVVLELRFLGLAPVGDYVPGWAGEIASAQAVQAVNAQLETHPIRLPIKSELTVPIDIQSPGETPIKTDNGTIFIAINLPKPPDVTRWLQPREVFFGRDALHVLVEMRSSKPDAATADNNTGGTLTPVTPTQLAAGLAPWRLAPGLDFSIRAGQAVLMELLAETNHWSEPQRTVKMQGTREDGHIKETTGGGLYGNGISAYLDDPKRLQGNVILRESKPEWDAAHSQILLRLTATAQAQGQLHVHNHPPKVFGHPVGGGAGTSIGVSVDPLTSTLSGALRLDPASGVFQVYLLDPEALNFKVHAGGIPDILLNLFNVGLNVPLPRNKPLASFRVPELLETKVQISPPGGQSRQLSLHVRELKVVLEPEDLHATGKIDIAR